MLVEDKQIGSGIEDKLDALLKAQFPTIDAITGYSTGSSLYTITNGRIYLEKSEKLNSSKLSTSAFCKTSNKKPEQFYSVTVDWSDAVAKFEATRHQGENVLHGHLYEFGVYNPKHLTADIIIEVCKDSISLTNWYANGAKIGNVSYADARTAEDLAILSEYDISSFQSAFEGMENLESIPLLSIKPGISIFRMDKMFADCKSMKTVPQLPSMVNMTNLASMFKDCASLTDASSVTIKPNAATNEMFSGCTSLVTLPNITSLANCTKMFYDCSSLPEEFPMFEVNNTTFKANHTDVFGGNCSVRKVKIKMNTAYDINNYNISVDTFGENVQEIVVVDDYGNIRETFTRE